MYKNNSGTLAYPNKHPNNYTDLRNEYNLHQSHSLQFFSKKLLKFSFTIDSFTQSSIKLGLDFNKVTSWDHLFKNIAHV